MKRVVAIETLLVNETITQSIIRSSGLLAALGIFLFLVPQLSFVVLHELNRYPFGNAIIGWDEWAIVYGATGVCGGLTIYNAFFVYLLAFLLRSEWWKRHAYVLLYLAVHLLATFAALTVYQGWPAAESADGILIVNAGPGILVQAPMVGCSVVFFAVLAQAIFGWQITQGVDETRAQGDEARARGDETRAQGGEIRARGDETRAQGFGFAKLFEWVLTCGIVFASWFYLVGFQPGEDVVVDPEELTVAIVPAVAVSLVSVLMMQAILRTITPGRVSLLVMGVLLIHLAAFGVSVAVLVNGSARFDAGEAMLGAMAATVTTAAASVCLLPCWLIARRSGFRLATG